MSKTSKNQFNIGLETGFYDNFSKNIKNVTVESTAKQLKKIIFFLFYIKKIKTFNRVNRMASNEREGISQHIMLSFHFQKYVFLP